MNDINYGFVQGKMLLYRKPEMLSLEQHQGLGISSIATPHAHTRDVHIVPLTLTEFVTAQKHYPIVFASLEQPVPLAVLGVIEQSNLFLNDEGHWDALTYVPAYLRCYPFALAQHGENQLALVVDRESEALSDQPEIPFFVDDKASDYISQMTEFCGRYQAERKRTEEFCKKLVTLDLLAGQHVSYTPKDATEQQILANYVSINTEKLQELDAETLRELHRLGELSAIYAQINSAENWNHLLMRRQLRSA